MADGTASVERGVGAHTDVRSPHPTNTTTKKQDETNDFPGYSILYPGYYIFL